MADRVYPLSTDHPVDPSVAQRHSDQQKNFQKAVHDSTYTSRTPLPLHHRDYSPRPRRCNPCCCCLGWLCSLLVVILVLLGVAALVFYLVLHPKLPNFSVTDAHVSVFNLTDTPTVQSGADAAASQYLQTDVNFTVEAGNPNKKIGIFYDDINVDLFYEGTQIGKGSLPAFYLGHRDTQDLQLEMKGQDVPLTDAIDSSLKTAVTSQSSISLEVKTAVNARVKIGSWKSRDTKFKVNCDVKISSPIAGQTTQLLSKNCKLKLVKIWA